MTTTTPTRAEISRSKLVDNFRLLSGLAGPETQLLAVVKANGYGHGLSDCARILKAEGARWFGVTSVAESIALRAVCTEARILALSGLWEGEADAVLEYGLTPVVWEAAHLDCIEEAARRRGIGVGEVPVHLEIDTGMSRQGVSPGELTDLLERFGRGSALRLEAVMTHFFSPDSPNATAKQMTQFELAVEQIVAAGLRPEYLSAGSSSDLLDASTGAVSDLARRCGAKRMMRAGLALYGYEPGRGTRAGLIPVLTWKTTISALREIEPGTAVGYGGTFIASRRTKLALLRVGYADGLNRLLSNCGSVLVRGQRAPVAGRISMDQTTVDVTEIEGASVGDEVVLIGEQGVDRITAADMAVLTGTIAYDVLCAITARVPRRTVE